MLRPLLIGQAPGPRTDPRLPLYPLPESSAGGRLRQLTGLSRGEYMRTFERVNVLNYFPGQVKRDDKFPQTPAKLAAATMRPLLSGRTAILVGRKVADAFGHEAEFLEWGWMACRRPCLLSGCHGRARVAVVPHTSGRNHWYNSEENRAAARKFWEDFTNSLR